MVFYNPKGSYKLWVITSICYPLRRYLSINKYASTLHVQKLYQVRFWNSAKRNYLAVLQFDLVYMCFHSR